MNTAFSSCCYILPPLINLAVHVMRLNLLALILILPFTSNASVKYKCTTANGGEIGLNNGVALMLVTDAKNYFQGMIVNGVEFKANAHVEDSVDTEMRKMRTFSADSKNENNAYIQSAFANVWRDDNGQQQILISIMNVKTGGDFTNNSNDNVVTGNISTAYCN